jgi:hypothetical protein
MSIAPSSIPSAPPVEAPVNRLSAPDPHPALLPLLRYLIAAAVGDVGSIAAMWGTATDIGVIVGVGGFLAAITAGLAAVVLAERLAAALGNPRASTYLFLLWLAQELVVLCFAAASIGLIPHA